MVGVRNRKKQMGIRIANAPLEALPGAWLLQPAPSAGSPENAAWSMSAPDGTGLREGTAEPGKPAHHAW